MIALEQAGHPPDFGGASPLFPIRRARSAAARGDEGEFWSPNAAERAKNARTDAMAAAPDIFDALPADAIGPDFADALLGAHPAIGEKSAADIASRFIRSRWAHREEQGRAPGPDPLETIATPERDARAMMQHDRASAMRSSVAFLKPDQPLKTREEITGTLRSFDYLRGKKTAPPAWLAKGLLPRAGIGLLFGETGSGKSFAAVHASLCVAYGVPFFGAKTKQGGVLYIAAEAGAGVARRIEAADEALDAITAPALRGAGVPPLDRAPIKIVTQAPDLSRDGDAKPLLRTIELAKQQFEREGHRLALVVLDTWHAALGGADENSSADAGHALKPLIAAAETGDFLMLAVHHPGKDSERGARGSSALPAAADVIIAVSVPRFTGAKAKPASAPRRAVVTKLRDGDPGREVGYRLRIVQTDVDEDGDPVTTCIVEPIDTPAVDGEGLTKSGRAFMDAVAQAVADKGGECGMVETARLMFCKAWAGKTPDANRKAWTRALREAVDAGRVGLDDNDVSIWLLTSPIDPDIGHP